jgi:DNA-binding beta-propeller fold protein YncE
MTTRTESCGQGVRKNFPVWDTLKDCACRKRLLRAAAGGSLAVLAWLVGLLVGLLVAGGCGQVAATNAVLRAWPPPPNEPRIVLRQVILGSKDFERGGFLEGLGRFLVGERKQTLLRPQAAAVDGADRLYVADQEHQGVHVFSLKGGGSEFLGRAGKEFLVSPAAVVMCEGRLAVSDSALARVFLLAPDGTLQRTLQRPGGFQRPTGMAYDADRKFLYVVDTLAHDVCVFNLSTGEFLRRFGGAGTGEGLFNYPTYVAVDADGTVYVTDSLNFRVQVFDLRGTFLRQIGRLGDATGYMAVPKGIAVDRHGHLYVVDSALSTVQIFDREGRFLLSFGERGDEPGQFQVPTGLAVGPDDRIYVCDSFSRRLQVFQYVETKDESTNAQ